jgi:hypothetical protein
MRGCTTPQTRQPVSVDMLAWKRRGMEVLALSTVPRGEKLTGCRHTRKIAHMTSPRIRAAVRHLIARHLIADEPTPEPSRLDRLDGLHFRTSAEVAAQIQARQDASRKLSGHDNLGRF